MNSVFGTAAPLVISLSVGRWWGSCFHIIFGSSLVIIDVPTRPQAATAATAPPGGCVHAVPAPVGTGVAGLSTLYHYELVCTGYASSGAARLCLVGFFYFFLKNINLFSIMFLKNVFVVFEVHKPYAWRAPRRA